MLNEINKEKISDFVDVFLQNIRIDRNHKHFISVSNIIKKSIYERAVMYQNIGFIPENFDHCTNYLIKPNENGKYSIEDFLLNRLFISLCDYNFESMGEIGLGGYCDKKIALSLDESYNQAMRITNDQKYSNAFAAESLVHEIGHALQSSFINSINRGIGFKYQTVNYLNLLDALKNCKNGKYKHLIVDAEKIDISDKLQKADFEGFNSHNYGESGYIKSFLKIDLHNVDEMMNELEALKVTKMTDESYKFDLIYDENNAKSGFYEMVPNVVCGYRKWYGISKEFYALLGKKNTFILQYGNTDSCLYGFDQKYKDISQQMFGEDYISPISIINYFVNNIYGENRTYKDYLMLHEFLARCIDKKTNELLERDISSSEEIKEFIELIDSILKSTLHHVDFDVDENLPHIIIYNNINKKLNQRLTEKKQFP